jgi:hypothetical protein
MMLSISNITDNWTLQRDAADVETQQKPRSRFASMTFALMKSRNYASDAIPAKSTHFSAVSGYPAHTGMHQPGAFNGLRHHHRASWHRLSMPLPAPHDPEGDPVRR